MHILRRLQCLLAGSALAATAACHNLEPMTEMPVANAEARVRLTDIGAATMAPTLGPGVTGLRGTILEIDSTRIRMTVSAVTDREGLESRWLGEQVTVPRAYVNGFDKRELSPFKTTLVTAGILAGMIAIGGAVSGGADGILQAFGLPRQR